MVKLPGMRERRIKLTQQLDALRRLSEVIQSHIELKQEPKPVSFVDVRLVLEAARSEPIRLSADSYLECKEIEYEPFGGISSEARERFRMRVRRWQEENATDKYRWNREIGADAVYRLDVLDQLFEDATAASDAEPSSDAPLPTSANDEFDRWPELERPVGDSLADRVLRALLDHPDHRVDATHRVFQDSRADELSGRVVSAHKRISTVYPDWQPYLRLSKGTTSGKLPHLRLSTTPKKHPRKFPSSSP